MSDYLKARLHDLKVKHQMAIEVAEAIGESVREVEDAIADEMDMIENPNEEQLDWLEANLEKHKNES